MVFWHVIKQEISENYATDNQQLWHISSVFLNNILWKSREETKCFLGQQFWKNIIKREFELGQSLIWRYQELKVSTLDIDANLRFLPKFDSASIFSTRSRKSRVCIHRSAKLKVVDVPNEFESVYLFIGVEKMTCTVQVVKMASSDAFNKSGKLWRSMQKPKKSWDYEMEEKREIINSAYIIISNLLLVTTAHFDNHKAIRYFPATWQISDAS